jgi:outer membrane protein, heavy metal efflux system
MPPSMEAIRILAKEIQRPILKPIDFDSRNGLSPDEAAILAVIANPKLRASRDQRKLAAAQLLQAGILPNPQLSYSLDIPTAGATQGTFTAFNFNPSWEIASIISRGAKIAAASRCGFGERRRGLAGVAGGRGSKIARLPFGIF